MSEGNKRVVILGLPAAEREFSAYVRKRLDAERSTGDLKREVQDLERQARDLERSVPAKAVRQAPTFGDLGRLRDGLDRAAARLR